MGYNPTANKIRVLRGVHPACPWHLGRYGTPHPNQPQPHHHRLFPNVRSKIALNAPQAAQRHIIELKKLANNDKLTASHSSPPTAIPHPSDSSDHSNC